jgi:hypothetical protein
LAKAKARAVARAFFVETAFAHEAMQPLPITFLSREVHPERAEPIVAD